MAKAYDKELLVNVYMSRFMTIENADIDVLVEVEQNANNFYDKVGKEEFRKWASVTAEEIRKYNALV